MKAGKTDLLEGPLDGPHQGDFVLLVRSSPGCQAPAFGLNLHLTEHAQDVLAVGHGINAFGEPIQQFLQPADGLPHRRNIRLRRYNKRLPRQLLLFHRLRHKRLPHQLFFQRRKKLKTMQRLACRWRRCGRRRLRLHHIRVVS